MIETDLKSFSYLDVIGTTAALELLAEECSELSQAALKAARKARGENPTPRTKEEIRNQLLEEIADVTVMIGQFVPRFISQQEVDNLITMKKIRAMARFKELGLITYGKVD